MAKPSKSAAKPAAKTGSLCFTDASGGAFAALAAAIARSSGRDALAATSSAAARVPAEVGTVLGEIALSMPEVVLAGKIPAGAERIDVSGWGHALYTGEPREPGGEGDLEKLALARIARDRIERRVEALFASRG